MAALVRHGRLVAESGQKQVEQAHCKQCCDPHTYLLLLLLQMLLLATAGSEVAAAAAIAVVLPAAAAGAVLLKSTGPATEVVLLASAQPGRQ
jgi:hypothetical protein